MVAVLCAAQAAGQSLANMPVNTWGINALENSQIAHGNAIANTGRQVAGGLGTAIIVTLMTTVTTERGLRARRNRRGDGSRHERSLYGMRRYRLVALVFGVLEDPRCKRRRTAASCDSRHCRRAFGRPQASFAPAPNSATCTFPITTTARIAESTTNCDPGRLFTET